jgi:hypothetical protein
VSAAEVISMVNRSRIRTALDMAGTPGRSGVGTVVFGSLPKARGELRWSAKGRRVPHSFRLPDSYRHSISGRSRARDQGARSGALPGRASAKRRRIRTFNGNCRKRRNESDALPKPLSRSGPRVAGRGHCPQWKPGLGVRRPMSSAQSLPSVKCPVLPSSPILTRWIRWLNWSDLRSAAWNGVAS